jgi:hypothetical protein
MWYKKVGYMLHKGKSAEICPIFVCKDVLNRHHVLVNAAIVAYVLNRSTSENSTSVKPALHWTVSGDGPNWCL